MKINHVSSPDFSLDIFINIYYLIELEEFFEYCEYKWE